MTLGALPNKNPEQELLTFPIVLTLLVAVPSPEEVSFRLQSYA